MAIVNGTKKKHRFLAGCGYRRVGKTYIYSDMEQALKKHPLSYFMFDPPREVPKDWVISAQGLTYIQHGGVWHVVDWVGINNYPNVSDIWEEILARNPDGKRRGASGLAPLTDHLRDLIPGKSWRYLVSPRAFIDNFKPYREAFIKQTWDECFLGDQDPKRTEHIHGDKVCSALWWQAVLGVKPHTPGGRVGTRQIGDTVYNAVSVIGDEDPRFRVGIIGRLPIDALEVPVGKAENRDKDIDMQIMQALQFLSSAATPVYKTDN